MTKEPSVTISWTNVTKVVGAIAALGTLIGSVKAMPKVIENVEAQGNRISVLEANQNSAEKRFERMEDKLDRILYRLPRRDR